MPPKARPTRPAPTAESTSKTMGAPGRGSRAQADSAAKHTEARQGNQDSPLAPDGFPLVMVEMAASELIPTGQYANISIGPARVRAYIDPRDDEPFSPDQLANIAKATNQLAELVEVDVIAVQRNIALESMQSQVTTD